MLTGINIGVLVTLLLAVLAAFYRVGGLAENLREAQSRAEAAAKNLDRLPVLETKLETLQSGIALATNEVRNARAELAEVKTRLVVVERTKQSRHEMPASRPGSYGEVRAFGRGGGGGRDDDD